MAAERQALFGKQPTLNSRIRQMPPLIEDGLWPAQIIAIKNLEKSLAENRPRALIQMATGSGKTMQHHWRLQIQGFTIEDGSIA